MLNLKTSLKNEYIKEIKKVIPYNYKHPVIFDILNFPNILLEMDDIIKVTTHDFTEITTEIIFVATKEFSKKTLVRAKDMIEQVNFILEEGYILSKDAEKYTLFIKDFFEGFTIAL